MIFRRLCFGCCCTQDGEGDDLDDISKLTVFPLTKDQENQFVTFHLDEEMEYIVPTVIQDFNDKNRTAKESESDGDVTNFFGGVMLAGEKKKSKRYYVMSKFTSFWDYKDGNLAITRRGAQVLGFKVDARENIELYQQRIKRCWTRVVKTLKPNVYDFVRQLVIYYNPRELHWLCAEDKERIRQLLFMQENIKDGRTIKAYVMKRGKRMIDDELQDALIITYKRIPTRRIRRSL